MFEVTIVTPDGKKSTHEVKRLSLPTTDGTYTLLANHFPIMYAIDIGTAKLIWENDSRELVVSEGICYFEENKADLLVRTFEFADEIDLNRAERAKERAEEELEKEESAEKAFELERAVQRAKYRLTLGGKER